MGEAKRRKLADPNFGKSLGQELITFELGTVQPMTSGIAELTKGTQGILVGHFFIPIEVHTPSGNFSAIAYPSVDNSGEIFVGMVALGKGDVSGFQEHWKRIEEQLRKSAAASFKEFVKTTMRRSS